jgi:hypothetical protein
MPRAEIVVHLAASPHVEAQLKTHRVALDEHASGTGRGPPPAPPKGYGQSLCAKPCPCCRRPPRSASC